MIIAFRAVTLFIMSSNAGEDRVLVYNTWSPVAATARNGMIVERHDDMLSLTEPAI